jgi:hypothetical protein
MVLNRREWPVSKRHVAQHAVAQRAAWVAVGVDVDLEQRAHPAHARASASWLFESLQRGAQLVSLVAVEAEADAAEGCSVPPGARRATRTRRVRGGDPGASQ